MTSQHIDSAVLSLLQEADQRTLKLGTVVFGMRGSRFFKLLIEQHQAEVKARKDASLRPTPCYEQYAARLIYLGMLLQQKQNILG